MLIRSIDNITVEMQNNIRNTIEVINRGSMGIALILDENRMLRGTVTDGDVRRAILRGVELDEKVFRIMQNDFLYVTENNVNDKWIMKSFKKRKIKQLPVLNQYKIPVGIFLLEDIYTRSYKKNIVILMAGGRGTRLKPLTNEIPKPMLKVGGKPILETIIDSFKKLGYIKFFISVNYKSHVIENYFQDGTSFGVKIKYLRENKRLGTAGAINLARKYITRPFFVMNGDVLTNLNFYNLMNFHNEYNYNMTIATRNYTFDVPYGVLKYNEDKIFSVDEKPKMSFSVNGGIYVLSPDMLDGIPDNQYFDMTELINNAIEENKRVGNYPIREYWLDIGHMQDYYKANQEIDNVFKECI